MKRIHIFGASGPGTTTLGRALADVVECPHFDTDTYFWIPTDPPFRTVRNRAERQELLRRDLEKSDSWVLSGSLCGWGDFAVPMFDLVVFLWLPPETRMQRLKEREIERYGPEIEDPQDPRYEKHREFLAWAEAYDHGGLDMRSRARHEEWMAGLPCRLLRIERETSTREQLGEILKEMSNNAFEATS